MAGLYTLSKSERLSSQKLIDKIFKREGEMITKFPLSFVFLEHPLEQPVPIQVMFSVSSRKIKKAHDRNRLKRLMKECYRLRKPELYDRLTSSGGKQFALCFMYLSEDLTTFDEIKIKTDFLIDEFSKRIV